MKFLSVILAMLCLSVSTTAETIYPPYWSCIQIGHINKQPVIIVSDIQNIPFNKKKLREIFFASTVRKTWKITGEYEPLCQDFHTKKEANQVRNLVFKKAKRAGLDILEIELQFGGEHVQKKE